jgi:hypothetical protein
MKKNQVTIGGRYHVRIGRRLAVVTVEQTARLRGRTHYACRVADSGRQIICTAARLRQIPETTGGTIVAPSGIPGMIINHARSIEQMGTYNARGIHRWADGQHVATTPLGLARAFCRHVRSGSLRQHPPAFRRGALHCLLSRHAANRAQYRDVMGHSPVPSHEMIAAALMGDRDARAAILATA